MGSLSAMKRVSADRYFQGAIKEAKHVRAKGSFSNDARKLNIISFLILSPPLNSP